MAKNGTPYRWSPIRKDCRHLVARAPQRAHSIKVHTFGGLWTDRKLQALEAYLNEYRKIFTKGRFASRYRTIYVDGFAGSGERADSIIEDLPSGYTKDIFGEAFEKQPEQKRKRGSASVALGIGSPFDQYLFVERDEGRAAQLRDLVTKEHEELLSRANIEVGDANLVISSWCESTDWKVNRAVVFLDPYGMSVNWRTVERIAGTKAIDLWILFPLGVGLNRLLTRGRRPPEAWAKKIDEILGTTEWRDVFYKELVERGLFDDDAEVKRIVKTATFDSMAEFFLNRLRSVFAGVSPDAMALTNSRGNPLFLLCFAAGNKYGAPIAVKIASHLLRD